MPSPPFKSVGGGRIYFLPPFLPHTLSHFLDFSKKWLVSNHPQQPVHAQQHKERAHTMRKVLLLKDITIPKGTIFNTAPCQTKRYGQGHLEATIGLSPNTSGSFTYFIDPDCIGELDTFFEDVDE